MHQYTRHLRPVTQPISERQQLNQAGGYTFRVDDETLLRRFLILGTDKGSYYADAREMTITAVTCIDRMLEAGLGENVVSHIVDVSNRGLAPKNDPAIFALALVLKTAPDVESRRAAAKAVPLVCRTASHLAGFVNAVEALGQQNGKEERKGSGGGWGPLTRQAIQYWINYLSAEDLAYQAVKYRQRQGIRLGDVLRLAHPEPPTHVHADVFDWILGHERMGGPVGAPRILDGYEEVQRAETSEGAVAAIRDYRLPWEAVPSRWARDLTVQAALFESMPVGATLRQLGRLTELGLLQPGNENARIAANRVGDGDALHKARVHPGAVYLALRQYGKGHGARGHLSWYPVPEIMEALEAGFFAAFRVRRPSRARLVVGVDCSGSMWFPESTLSSGIPAAEAASVMAYLQTYGNPNATMLAFDTKAKEVSFGAYGTLASIEQSARHWGMGGGTNCALPIMWALQAGKVADGIAIYTDSQTWQGPHPVEVMMRYRAAVNPGARMVDVAFVANVDSTVSPGFDDAGMLQVVGLDASSPQLVDNFLTGSDHIEPEEKK